MINLDIVQTLLTGLNTTYATVNNAGYIIMHGSLFPAWIVEERDSLIGADIDACKTP